MLIDKRELLDVHRSEYFHSSTKSLSISRADTRVIQRFCRVAAAATDPSASEMPPADRIEFKNCDVQIDAIVAYFRLIKPRCMSVAPNRAFP